MPSLSSLSGTLGYRFRDESLLVKALTHRSAGSGNYERLEFLGDSILGFIIADRLFHHFPDAPEGELSRHRADLVQQGTLAALARGLDLGRYIILGKGERKSGGADRDSILSDIFEAVVSAIYLDGGLESCQQAILPLFDDCIDRLREGQAHKDPKTRLQEYLQGLKQALPVYTVEAVEGKDHDQKFHVQCLVPDSGLNTEGRGSSRKEAEQHAAEKALELLDGAA